MLRRAAAPAVLLLLAVSLVACGKSTEEEYADGFKPLNDKILTLGRDVGRTISRASSKSDKQLEQEFGAYAERMGDLQQQVDDLEPPEDLKADQEQLVQAMGDLQGDLEDIEKAAGNSSASGARAATVELFRDSASLANARRKIARATGAKVSG